MIQKSQRRSYNFQNKFDDFEKGLTTSFDTSVFAKTQSEDQRSALIWALGCDRAGDLRCIKLSHHFPSATATAKKWSWREACRGKEGVLSGG